MPAVPRGWLDRGELDKIIDRSVPQATATPHHRGTYNGGYKRTKRDGFLDELFDVWGPGMNKSLTLAERQGLPEALRVLADAYPRANWDRHANFGELVRFWMQRHAMFRQLIDVLQTDVKQVLSAEIPFEAYRPRLSRYGGLLLNELHTHHQVEDHHYFPQLVTLDARLERGFELLESDHDAMDGLLHQMAEGANAVLQGGEPGPFLERLTGFGALLDRHLTDEEDIVVPVILDTGFKG